MEHSKPIKINKSSSNLQREYCLKEIGDNPFKTSPPNSWNTRLGERYMNHFFYGSNGSNGSNGSELNALNNISIEKCNV